jgi:tRNA pseudouridine55 synthase
LRVDVTCSAGTYVRVLAADLGHLLGGGAHLTDLRRTAVGAFEIDDCCALDALVLRPPADAVRGLPGIEVDGEVTVALRHGRSIAAPSGSTAPGPIAVLQGRDVIAIVEVDRRPQAEPNALRPVLVIPENVGAG